MSIESILIDIEGRLAGGRWKVIGVMGDAETSPMCYTVGLHSLGYPELIMVGLSLDTGQNILNDAAQQVIDSGSARQTGNVFDKVANLPLIVVEVEDDELRSEYTAMASHYYGTDPYRLQQIVMPDSNGKFPWDEGVDEHFLKVQPLLGKPITKN